MNNIKKFYLFIFLLALIVLASSAILGSLLEKNIGKDPNTITISLPSLLPDSESDLDEWKYVSEMTIFGSNIGQNRDKVIAPGMTNSAEIVIDNRNSDALDYEINFNFSSSEEDYWIPLQMKITRYDGTVLTEGYSSIEDIASISDSHTIGGERYAYYLVEWYWPDGENDAEFGDYVLDKNIRIFASVDVETAKSANKDATNGMKISYKQEAMWEIINTVIGAILVLFAGITCIIVLRLQNSYADFERYPIKRY